MAYEHFYRYYDRLMDDIPYEHYIDFVKSHLQRGTHLLDLGCGTGSVLIPLLKAGYQVDGLDGSEEMLMVLQDKLLDDNRSTNLYCDDMRNIRLEEYYDGIYSFIDTINYLTTPSDLKQTFEGIYHSLKPGGIFIFDIHNKKYIEEVFMDYSYHEHFSDFSYLWDTFLEITDEKTTIDHTLTFFIRLSNGTYERVDEEHRQTVYPLDRYLALLKAAGFQSIEVLSDFQPFINIEASKFQLICRKMES